MTSLDRAHPFSVDYGPVLEAEVDHLQQVIQNHPDVARRHDPRWLAVKLLEGEAGIASRIGALDDGPQILAAAAEAAARLSCALEFDPRLAIADRRYAFVGQVVERVIEAADLEQSGVKRQERLDGVLTHPVLGVLLFLFVMYLVFSLVVEVSAPFLNWIDALFAGPLTRWTAWALNRAGAPVWLRGMLIEGVIAGVGGVLVFVPGLVVMFGFMAFLEDSGYLARAAFVMNRGLSWMGLNGKSFVPLVLGFGCAVPAVYATRTLERRRDRILTALLIPLMSCSARLPVYVVFSLAFFKDRANLAIWSLYALGVAVAAFAGWIFSRTLLRSDDKARFMLELPPYRWPGVRDIALMVRYRTNAFLRNAGTVILAASIAIWLLLNLPAGAHDLESTYFGGVSKRLAPVFAPAGFGTWEATGSLVSGLVAKEVVVATMSQIYLGEGADPTVPAVVDLAADLRFAGGGFLAAVGEAGIRLIKTLTLGAVDLGSGMSAGQGGTALSQALQQSYSAPAGAAFLVYVLLYIPCVATLGALRAEFGWRWAGFAALYQSLVAWMGAVGVYQIARILERM